jgi:hypothetical protein
MLAGLCRLLVLLLLVLLLQCLIRVCINTLPFAGLVAIKLTSWVGMLR